MKAEVDGCPSAILAVSRALLDGGRARVRRRRKLPALATTVWRELSFGVLLKARTLGLVREEFGLGPSCDEMTAATVLEELRLLVEVLQG